MRSVSHELCCLMYISTITLPGYSSSFSGGSPHGNSIFCSRLYLMRPTDSFSATEKYTETLWCPM